ncbi:MAG: hypothetical protein LBQ12_08070 [Deltaproteobacteria bacterium]|jgi:hypothetical protein|nr:hypothetical protein [Deltaproteobacteria bacterium]
MREVYTKNALLSEVVRRLPDIPPQVTRLAVEIVIQALPDGLAEGRPVSLRGFGRLIPRRYSGSSSKKIGLLFHASPRLAKIVEEAGVAAKKVSASAGKKGTGVAAPKGAAAASKSVAASKPAPATKGAAAAKAFQAPKNSKMSKSSSDSKHGKGPKFGKGSKAKKP